MEIVILGFIIVIIFGIQNLEQKKQEDNEYEKVLKIFTSAGEGIVKSYYFSENFIDECVKKLENNKYKFEDNNFEKYELTHELLITHYNQIFLSLYETSYKNNKRRFTDEEKEYIDDVMRFARTYINIMDNCIMIYKNTFWFEKNEVKEFKKQIEYLKIRVSDIDGVICYQ